MKTPPQVPNQPTPQAQIKKEEVKEAPKIEEPTLPTGWGGDVPKVEVPTGWGGEQKKEEPAP